MLCQAAEDSYRLGLAALEGGRHREGLALFEAAIELERRQGVPAIQARYLSHYGLCLALVAKREREGIYFCRRAISQEEFNADLHWNLGRAMLASGRRRGAYNAFRSGLAFDPGHRGIRRELNKMGWRRRPVLPFLSRSNPLNIMLGKALFG